MLFGRKALGAVAAAVMWAFASPASLASQLGAQSINFVGESASAEARQVAHWIIESRDNRGRPFAIVDKKDAKVYVFTAEGRVLGAAAALLGLARGDDSADGIGERKLSQIPPAERITPAGRFESEPGRNLHGEDVVWVDYDSGFAIHRLRPANSNERRPERLASQAPNDHRISFGCVVVPVAFYDSVISPLLGKARGVVYVLPETRPLHEVFGIRLTKLASH